VDGWPGWAPAGRGRSAEGLAWASRLFHFSLAYLALLFGLAAGTAILAR